MASELNVLPHPDQAVVTGAFGYTGRYVVRRLLDDDVRVRTLTRNPDRGDPFAGRVKAHPLDFSDPEGLCRSMEGAGVLYNTYWIRNAHGGITFDHAVRNTGTLFQAAVAAGVGRIVHFSVANPSNGYDLPYFSGKAQVEGMLKDMGISYAIIRPTLVFGQGDLLLNNMAWALRRFPVFPVFGAGGLPAPADSCGGFWRPGRWRPVRVRTASSPTPAARRPSPSRNCCVYWPRRWGTRVRLVPTPPSLAFALTRLVGLFLRDVALTRDEVDGLMAGLLSSGAAPTCTTRLGDWLEYNADGLGRGYVSESRRNVGLHRQDRGGDNVGQR